MQKNLRSNGDAMQDSAMYNIMQSRVALSVVLRYRRYEPSKGLVSQSLSSKLTCEREMAHKAQNAFKRALSRERSAHKALELLLTAVLACFNSVKHCFSML